MKKAPSSQNLQPLSQKLNNSDLSEKKLNLREFLPEFSENNSPLVFIENTRFDAKKYCYPKPYVMIGNTGFLVDYGYRIGYFSSTWQGQINQSLRFQDLKLLVNLAKKRTREKHDYNARQLGLWDSNWAVGGCDEYLIKQFGQLVATQNAYSE